MVGGERLELPRDTIASDLQSDALPVRQSTHNGTSESNRCVRCSPLEPSRAHVVGVCANAVPRSLQYHLGTAKLVYHNVEMAGLEPVHHASQGIEPCYSRRYTNLSLPFPYMSGPGLEPGTNGLKGRDSNQLSYPDMYVRLAYSHLERLQVFDHLL